MQPTDAQFTAKPEEVLSRTGTARRRRPVFVAILGSAVLSAAAVSYVWYLSSYVDATVYGRAELAGKTICQIIPWQDGRTAVQISRASDISADTFWHIITNHHSYHDLMPGVDILSERDNGDGTTAVEQILRLPHANYALELEVSTESTGAVRRWKWRQTRGNLLADDGAFVVEDHGDHTILRYQVSASVPDCPQWLVNLAMRTRHESLFELMEKHAQAGTHSTH